MNERVAHLASDAGPLLEVRGAADGLQRYDSLAFVFQRGALRLSCDSDTDEIQVDVAAGPLRFGDLISKAPFAEIVGMTLEYAWQLTNHHGYRDAWQMRFLSLESRAEASLQFEVAAAAIAVSLVTRA